MPGRVGVPALGGPMCVERVTGGEPTSPATLVAGGPPGISGLDIQVHARVFRALILLHNYTIPVFW